MVRNLSAVSAVLLDLDGTLAIGGEPIAGAAEAVATIQRAGLPVRIVTNTTRHSRHLLAEQLRRAGFAFVDTEIFSVPVLASRWLHAHGLDRVMPILASPAWVDLEALTLVKPDTSPTGRVDAVLVGDPGPELRYQHLNHAFRALMGGAKLVACQRNRYWQEPDGLSIDAGPLVAALEYAAGVEAELVGKPAGRFFLSAVESLELPTGDPPSSVLMVGDDIVADVLGAQDAGLRGCLVRTGKFREGDLDGRRANPDVVLGSVADLPAALGLG